MNGNNPPYYHYIIYNNSGPIGGIIYEYHDDNRTE